MATTVNRHGFFSSSRPVTTNDSSSLVRTVVTKGADALSAEQGEAMRQMPNDVFVDGVKKVFGPDRVTSNTTGDKQVLFSQLMRFMEEAQRERDNNDLANDPAAAAAAA